jgi:leucyl/phenylalanyl-tRNA--protein transferase
VIEPHLLLQAYASGWFPMAVDDPDAEGVEWFSPDPRGIIPLERFHVPKRLERVIRQGKFEITLDQAFADVMRACAARDETWINQEILESYRELHRLGFAHSVECWLEGRLVGGLYGVSLRGAFFGESMFHRVTDASKVALHELVGRLEERRYALLDVQWVTPHLVQFGAVEVRRPRYLQMLQHAMTLERTFV